MISNIACAASIELDNLRLKLPTTLVNLIKVKDWLVENTPNVTLFTDPKFNSKTFYVLLYLLKNYYPKSTYPRTKIVDVMTELSAWISVLNYTIENKLYNIDVLYFCLNLSKSASLKGM